MSQVQQLLTEYLDIWTAAEMEKKSGRGRASGAAGKVYGIQKLRSLILDLAVRGKLVPQDPNDETASELLKCIQAEKSKLIAQGELKKEKPLAPISDDEKLFELPKGWEWVRLGLVGRIFNGNSINENEKLEKYTNRKTGYPFIATKDVGYGRDELEYENGVLIPFDEKVLKIAHKGAVLICAEGGSAGKKVGITNQDICFGNKLFANEVWAGIEPFYIFHLYQSVAFYSLFQRKMTGIIGGISLNEFLSIPIPLPSSSEQRRIVAKVDELMALCDQLEQQHSNSTEAHEKLVEHLLSTLTQVQNAQDFNSQWQRIYAHFDTLFTTEASIDALKQTLLQLAVMGKLVPQDPSDEPASELLKRIQTEKAKLIAEGKLKKEKILAPIKDDEKLFELPKGWVRVQLQDITKVITCGMASTPEYKEKGRIFLSAKNVKPYKFLPADHQFVDEETYRKITQNANPEKGDILLTRVGAGIGEAAVINVEIEFAFYVSLTLIKPFHNHLNSYYLLHWLNSPEGTKKSIEHVYGAGVSQGNLNVNQVRTFTLPIPPLAEQHRIVAKVDELMSLCDKLKTCIQQASQQQQKLADALVAQALI